MMIDSFLSPERILFRFHMLHEDIRGALEYPVQNRVDDTEVISRDLYPKHRKNILRSEVCRQKAFFLLLPLLK